MQKQAVCDAAELNEAVVGGDFSPHLGSVVIRLRSNVLVSDSALSGADRNFW
jgi:hypothetical protein